MSDTQRTLSNIHAVARHLLNVDPGSEELYVGVTPLPTTWSVKVTYQGFRMVKVAAKLDDALDDTLRDLTNHVARKLDDGMRIVALMRNTGEPSWSHDGIENAALGVYSVEAVNVVSHEPGVVIVSVTPKGIQKLEERDAMCVALGAALERVRPAGSRFEVKVIGLVVDTFK